MKRRQRKVPEVSLDTRLSLLANAAGEENSAGSEALGRHLTGHGAEEWTAGHRRGEEEWKWPDRNADTRDQAGGAGDY